MTEENKDKGEFRFFLTPGKKKKPDPPGKDNQDRPKRLCELDAPYPEPRVAGPNLYYAQLLLEDYAGPYSELTAISQYVYHDFTLHEQYPDVAELAHCIAIVEMHHLELLAETILLLGEDPRFWYTEDNEYIYWSADQPYYGVNICDRLAADIEAEAGAIRQYRQHQEMIRDPYVDALLDRIILDEQHHLALFTQAYEKYCTKCKP